MKKETPKRRRKVVVNGSGLSPEGSSEDVKSLKHELGVHQEELKAQNEELQLAQSELTDARDRYKELFDSAPIGYLVVDGNFMIREANIKAAALCGVLRKDLIGTPLSNSWTGGMRMPITYIYGSPEKGDSTEQWTGVPSARWLPFPWPSGNLTL